MIHFQLIKTDAVIEAERHGEPLCASEDGWANVYLYKGKYYSIVASSQGDEGFRSGATADLTKAKDPTNFLSDTFPKWFADNPFFYVGTEFDGKNFVKTESKDVSIEDLSCAMAVCDLLDHSSN